MLFLAAFALIFALFAIRRAIPILTAIAVGLAVWTATRDAGATAVALASGLVASSWLIDVASRRAETRSMTIVAEVTIGALGAATLAAMIAHGLNGNVTWVAVAAAIGAAGVVARWRQVVF